MPVENSSKTWTTQPFDWFSPKITKAGWIQQSQHWIGSCRRIQSRSDATITWSVLTGESKAGRIHQSPTTNNKHMINQQVSPENSYCKKKKLCRRVTEKCRNWLEINRTGRRQAEHADDTKNKSKNCRKVKLSHCRSFTEMSPKLAEEDRTGRRLQKQK